MKDGVIADFEITEMMLREFIKKSQKKRHFIRPRIVIAVPSGITEVERRAVRDSAEHAGAREVFLIAEPIAAAIGVGLPVDKPSGNMIIDIGGGTTEIAVIALDGIVADSSIRVAGDELDEAIVNYVKRTYNMLIGEQTAEQIKMKIGCAVKMEKPYEMEIKGRDLVAGIPKNLKLTSEEIREAISVEERARADAARTRRRHRRSRDRHDRGRRDAEGAGPVAQEGDWAPHQRRGRSIAVRCPRGRKGTR
jgi:rod shape-determining protein MreB